MDDRDESCLLKYGEHLLFWVRETYPEDVEIVSVFGASAQENFIAYYIDGEKDKLLVYMEGIVIKMTGDDDLARALDELEKALRESVVIACDEY